MQILTRTYIPGSSHLTRLRSTFSSFTSSLIYVSNTNIQVHQIQLLNGSHPPDLSLSQILIQTLIQMLPPFKQHRITDQVRVSFDIDVSCDEEAVINCAI